MLDLPSPKLEATFVTRPTKRFVAIPLIKLKRKRLRYAYLIQVKRFLHTKTSTNIPLNDVTLKNELCERDNLDALSHFL